ncbi:hypothetical protein TSUD_45110 [Trifolium subterraneum]|nr:hypothetical protein TSUD_45110 [Trifolium subterraneum]
MRQIQITGKMKAIFCGNFEYDCRESELERLFRRYGKVDRVDMKAGAFRMIYGGAGSHMRTVLCFNMVTENT